MIRVPQRVFPSSNLSRYLHSKTCEPYWDMASVAKGLCLSLGSGSPSRNLRIWLDIMKHHGEGLVSRFTAPTRHVNVGLAKFLFGCLG